MTYLKRKANGNWVTCGKENLTSFVALSKNGSWFCHFTVSFLQSYAKLANATQNNISWAI